MNPSPQRCKRTSPDTASHGGATAIGRQSRRRPNLPRGGRGNRAHSRGRTGHLRRARHVEHRGNVGSPAAPRGAGRRSRRSTPRTGKPATWGRAAGVLRPRRGGTRDAERRNRPGDHPRPRQVRGLGGHWRAGCSERRTPGSGRGGWKSAGIGNSLAAYSTCLLDGATPHVSWRRIQRQFVILCLWLGNMVATVLVQLEGHGGHPGGQVRGRPPTPAQLLQHQPADPCTTLASDHTICSWTGSQ